MARKQSVLKIAREKQKESNRDDKNREKRLSDSQANRLELKSIMKKNGHNTKQIDEVINSMDDSQIQMALTSCKSGS